MGSFLTVFLLFAGYACLHSLLLTASGRALLEAVLGRETFRGTFRFLFCVQAAVLLVPVVLCAALLPDRELLVVSGSPALALGLLRAVGLALIGFCIWRVGPARFIGWDRFRGWRRGETFADDGVETGELLVAGPYRWVRHPMYATGFLVLWAEPRWGANYLAFALAASLYLWLGALHEERRLLQFYGTAYRDYAARTPSFLPQLRSWR